MFFSKKTCLAILAFTTTLAAAGPTSVPNRQNQNSAALETRAEATFQNIAARAFPLLSRVNRAGRGDVPNDGESESGTESEAESEHSRHRGGTPHETDDEGESDPESEGHRSRKGSTSSHGTATEGQTASGKKTTLYYVQPRNPHDKHTVAQMKEILLKFVKENKASKGQSATTKGTKKNKKGGEGEGEGKKKSTVSKRTASPMAPKKNTGGEAAGGEAAGEGTSDNKKKGKGKANEEEGLETLETPFDGTVWFKLEMTEEQVQELKKYHEKITVEPA